MQRHRGNSGVQVMVRGLLRSLSADRSDNQAAIASAWEALGFKGSASHLAAVLKQRSSCANHARSQPEDSGNPGFTNARPQEVDKGNAFWSQAEATIPSSLW